MIKRLLLVSICLACFTSYSQLYKNNWILGGSGSFKQKDVTYSSASIEYDSKFTEFIISPNAYYFVADKFSIGVKSTFDWYKSKAYPPGGGVTNMTRISGGPSLRYYLLEIDKQYNIVTQASLQYGMFKSGIDKGNIYQYSFLGGPVIFFNSSVGLEILLGYTYNKEDVKDRFNDINRGFQLEIGFQYYLENKN